jgi:methyl-accepting chemotaxis protein
MLTKINQILFVAPVFEGDEDKTRISKLLNTILLAFLAVTLAMAATVSVLEETALTSYLALAAIGLLVIGALVLMRLGYIRVASALFAVGLLAFDTALVAVSGGTSNPMVVCFLNVPMVAGLLLGARAVIVFGGLTAAADLGIYWLESRGLLAEPIIASEQETAVLVLVGVMAMACTLLYLGFKGTNTALARARRNEREVIESNRELQDIHASLEERNEHIQAVVKQYGDYMTKVGQGNLSSRLELNEDEHGQDPLVTLGHRLNESVSNLQSMIGQIHEAASSLSTQTAEILATTAQQATGAAEQSAAVSQATTTVDEIKTIAEQLVNRSQAVADTAQRTVEVSCAGQEVSRETIAGMGQIKARVDVIEENILALSERTQQIGEIIDVVNDIASQSNMLALNAAVEAARAGEQGKGFAVVAEEVRDLAERSRQATVQVKTILSDIQKATASTAMATEEGKKGVDAGVELVARMRDAIDQLAGVIGETSQSAMQMAAGGQQQMTGMEQIAVAMQHINQVTIQGMSGTRQAEKSVDELNELARSLTEIVEQYQV